MLFFRLTPENEFLQKIWTINTYNNEEFTIKNWEKCFILSLWKGFLDFFASVSSGTMVILT